MVTIHIKSDGERRKRDAPPLPWGKKEKKTKKKLLFFCFFVCKKTKKKGRIERKKISRTEKEGLACEVEVELRGQKSGGGGGGVRWVSSSTCVRSLTFFFFFVVVVEEGIIAGNILALPLFPPALSPTYPVAYRRFGDRSLPVEGRRAGCLTAARAYCPRRDRRRTWKSSKVLTF